MEKIFYEKTKKNKGLTYLINLFSFFIIFEIFIRNSLGNLAGIMNLVKILFCIIFVMYIIFIKKRLNNKYKYVHWVFFTLLFVVCIKLLFQGSINDFQRWIAENNDINYIFWYIYFFIFSQIYEDIDYNVLIKGLKIINYIVVFLTFTFFITNNYLGMVSYEFMLEFNWVGTNKTRAMSIFGNPNHAGLYFTIMLCILDITRITKRKSIFTITNILLIICNVLTFSRTSMIIMIIYIIIRYRMILNKDKNKWGQIIKKYKYFIVTIFTIIIFYILINDFNIYFFKLKNLISNTRIERWGIGLEYIRKYPVIGTPFSSNIEGIGSNFERLIFSDNMFIEIGARFGVVLISLILVFIIYIVIKSIRNKDLITINKLQLFIISSMLSGTLHFSIPLYLFILYLFIPIQIPLNKEEGDYDRNYGKDKTIN